MKRRFTILSAALALLVFMMPSLAAWGQTKITDYTNIVSGTRYYIGATTGSTDYYLSVDGSSLTISIAGTAVTSTSNATPFTFAGSGTTWTIQFDNGYYLSLKNSKDNGKVQVVENSANFISSNQTSKIRMQISGANYSIQKNNNGTQFGSYGNTQTDIWLMEVPSSSTTYTVTFDVGDGTFVGNNDFSSTTNTKEVGTYTLPSATPATGYTFDGWTAAGISTPITGSYTVSSNIEFTAQYTQSGGGTNPTYTYNFAGANNFYTDAALTTHPSSGSGNNVETIYYGDGSTFVASGTSRYFSSATSGYFMLGKTGAQISLPTFAGYKITQVIVHTSGSVSSNVQVSIVSGNNTASAAQQWSANSDFTYDIAEDYQTSALSLKVTNNYNSQFTSIELVCEADVPSTDPSINASNVDIVYNATSGSIAYTIENEPIPAGTMTAAVVEGGTIANLTIGNITSSAVSFTCAANTTVTERTATVTLTYSYNRETLTKNVIITQAGDPNAVDNISDITGDNQSHAVRGTVVGVNSKGFVLGDGTGYVYIYLNANPGVSVGDIRKVSGTTGSYNHVIQYTSSATIETASSSDYNNAPAVQALDATEISAYNQGLHLSDYVQIEGLLEHSGNYYNITVEGVSSTASISYPNDAQQTILNTFNNKQVIIKGYFAGVASGHFNVILESIEEVIAAVEAPTFSPAAGTYTEAQTVTLSCATANSTIYYTLDGTEPTSSSTQYTSPLTISSTTTVKAIAYVGTDASTVATATYHFCSAEDPYTVTEALAFNEYPANGIYVHGIVSTAPTSLSSGTLTYYISDDGTTATQLEVYKGKDLNNEAFTAADDIQVGDIVTIYGNVVIYNGTKEFSSGNYLVSFERPAQQYTLTVSPSENVEIYTFVGGSTGQGVEGTTTQQVTSGTTVGISVSAAEGYVLVLVVDDTDVTSQLDESGWYEFTMPAHNVNVTATASVAPVVTTNTYTLATSIESGKTYIIVGESNYDYYAMGNDKGNNRYAYEITLNGTTATATIAEGNYVHEFTISSLATAGFYSICDAITPGYLYAASSGDNYLKTETTLDGNHNGDWKITFNTDGSASIIASNSEFERNIMRFNNSSHLFSCYKTGQHPVYLYVKDETPVTETYQLDVPGYAAGSAGGYRLIASPVTVKPADVQGMILTGDDAVKYDLFYFDQSNMLDGTYLEWVNYKSGNHPNFNLDPGKGYLYAQQATTEGEVFQFTLSGSPYTGNGIIPLDYDASARFAGWNLIGNPYATAATLDKPFYKMDANGVGLGAQIEDLTNTIAAMEGVFVQVNAEDGKSAKFTPQRQSNQPASIAYANIVVNDKKGSVLDNAIVRFDNGETLVKFQLNRNSTKVYFSENNNDYAIVRGEEMGAMPVNFKAENNGTYTLNVSGQNTEFAYLHLIDNMTGNDVDLLQTPSYSFEAKTTDYESRFKLVFATGDNSNDDTFAFYSNGSFVINNEGNATLQVIDITGRIVKSESINGCANVSVNGAAGVYMLRLVNGDNVKTQKVVVK